jgi:hypothetical protein
MAAQETQESQFEDTKQGWASRWQMEIKLARKALEDFYKVGQEVDEALRDEKENDKSARRLCLYRSNYQTIGAMLFGRTPQASVTRKFADSEDDEARVAAEMMERVLNCDIEREDDTFAEATRNAMMDWRGPGLGVTRHRYEIGPLETIPGTPAVLDEQTGMEVAPAVPEVQRPSWEKVETDYVHWRDFLWGQCRVWDERPWVAFNAKMTKAKVAKKFGENAAGRIPYNAKKINHGDDKNEGKAHPWDRAEVWEVWHKDSKRVFFVVEGFAEVLVPEGLEEGDEPGQVSANGGLNDPLELPGFFPCQKPMMANLTTSKLIPVADYKFSQDLYNSIDVYTTRIAILAKAARLAAAYNKDSGKILEELVKGGENKAYPVDNWAAFAEKGGLKGVIDYLPLDQIVGILQTLRDLRREDIDLLYQVEGQSDLQRGQQTVNGTPGEAQVKAKFASVRMQAMQDEIARFASDGQRIRAHIIARHFRPETIVEHSNVMRTPDAPYAQKAVELIKSRLTDYRIEVKPEAINLTDFAALKEERFESLAGIATYFQAMLPAVEKMGPASLPHFLKMLQVSFAGTRGASAYESILDAWVASAEQMAQQAAQNPQQQPPDPKIQAAQMKMQSDQIKAQGDLVKIQASVQAKAQELQFETEAKAQQEQNQARSNVQEHAAKLQITQALKPPEPMGPGRLP